MHATPLLKAAGIILIIHGVIELLGVFAVFTGEPPDFVFGEIKTNWQQAILIGITAGTIRIIAAFGILQMMKWGVVLGIVISAITFSMLTFYLPFGVMDALLAGVVLVALVMVWWGKEKIT